MEIRNSLRGRGVPGVLGVLVVIAALAAVASTAMLPFVVVWAHDTAGLEGSAAGTLFLAQAAGEFGAGLVVGRLADRWGRRRVLILSTLGMATGYGLLAVASGPAVSILLFLAAGVFESAFHPTVGALVADAVPEDRLVSSFGLVRVAYNVGRIIGPLVGAVVALVATSLVFALTGATLLVAALLAMALLPSALGKHVGDQDDEPEIPPGTLRALRLDRGLLTLVLSGGLISVTFTWFQSDGFVILRQQTSLTEAGYAWLFTVAAATVAVAQWPVSRITSRTPPGPTMLVGGCLQGLGLAALAFAHTGYPTLVAAVVLMALGEATYGPVLSTVVSRRAGSSRRASYMAALSISEDLGSAVGPTTGLALVGAVPAAVLWFTGGLLSAAAGAVNARVAAGSSTPAPDPTPEDEPRRREHQPG
nr:MFS transporter [Streptomyces antibioticus]